MFGLKRFSTTMSKICRRSCSCLCDSGSAPRLTKLCALSNGVRIATEETESPIVCVGMFVNVGTVNEKPELHGITHFIEHIAYRGFKSIGKIQLEDCLASMGAKMSVLTTREFQVFYGQCLAEHVNEIVCMLSKIITDLELAETELEMAKCMIDMESRDSDNNPKAVVSDYLHETAFQGTPLGRRIVGPSRNVRKFNRYDVECYITENYFPTRLVIATSGAVKHENMITMVGACFGNLSQTCDVEYWPPQRFTGSQISYRDDSMKFTHVAMAVEAPGIKSPNYIPMLLASNIIGSYNKSQGGTNRHGAPLAEAGATSSICEHVESFYIPYRSVGLWGVYMVADKMDIEDLIHNVQNLWMHLCLTTSANDVERGCNAAKLELAKKIDGSVKSCLDIGTQVMYKRYRKYLHEFNEDLSKANEKVIKEVANHYLYDKCPVISAIGPVEALPDYTRLRAGMYWLRL